MQHDIIHLKDSFDFLGNNGCDPVVEMYLPFNMTEMNRQDRKRPCMIVCPGGGYRGCSQREAEPIALHFANEGFNVFTITYSVKPHCFPTQLREVAALMELIYKNADEWNCDTAKIAIIGFSAGGHLAAHYSTMFDCKEVREVFPESKGVNATVLCYPVITADPKHCHKGSFVNLTGNDINEDTVNKFSCDRNVTENTPPAFLWHTAEDNTVPVMNSILYATALQNYKIPFELHIYPYGSHGGSTCDTLSCDNPPDGLSHAHAWLDSVKSWLKLMGIKY